MCGDPALIRADRTITVASAAILSKCRRADALIRPITTALIALAVVAPGFVHAAGAPVVVGVAERQAVVKEVPVTGTVTSPRVARLSPEVAGLVSEVLVDAGARVDA
ncbi:MAG: hypothetical protein WBM71_17660, partial [Sedimenticolaceae bacterium]